MSDPIDGPPRPDPASKPPANPAPPPRRDPVIEVSVNGDKLLALEQDLGIVSNRAELLQEDIEATHMFLDDLRVPRVEPATKAELDHRIRTGRAYSIVGRIKVLLDHHVGDVCLCGCSMEDHEQYEEGLSCGNDDHECYLVWSAVAEMFQKLRDDRERLQENWTDTARHHARNEEFWRGLVRQTGELLGIEAKTSDDGSVQQDVLGLKVPGLVQGLVNELAWIDETLARRPALDKSTRAANIEHCIATAGQHDKVKAELEKLREGAGQMVDNLSSMSADRDIECQAWRDQAPHGPRCASRHCGDCGGKALMCCPPCDCYRAALLARLDNTKTANFGLKARIDGLVEALKRIQADHPTYELVDLRAIARTALRTFGMDSPGRRLVDGEIHGVHRNASGQEISANTAGNCLDLKVEEGLKIKVKLSEDFEGRQAYVWIEQA